MAAIRWLREPQPPDTREAQGYINKLSYPNKKN